MERRSDETSQRSRLERLYTSCPLVYTLYTWARDLKKKKGSCLPRPQCGGLSTTRFGGRLLSRHPANTLESDSSAAANRSQDPISRRLFLLLLPTLIPEKPTTYAAASVFRSEAEREPGRERNYTDFFLSLLLHSFHRDFLPTIVMLDQQS